MGRKKKRTKQQATGLESTAGLPTEMATAATLALGLTSGFGGRFLWRRCLLA